MCCQRLVPCCRSLVPAARSPVRRRHRLALPPTAQDLQCSIVTAISPEPAAAGCPVSAAAAYAAGQDTAPFIRLEVNETGTGSARSPAQLFARLSDGRRQPPGSEESATVVDASGRHRLSAETCTSRRRQLLLSLDGSCCKRRPATGGAEDCGDDRSQRPAGTGHRNQPPPPGATRHRGRCRCTLCGGMKQRAFTRRLVRGSWGGGRFPGCVVALAWLWQATWAGGSPQRGVRHCECWESPGIC